MNLKLNAVLESSKQFWRNDMAKKLKENWRLLLVAAIVTTISLNSFWTSRQTPSESPKTGQGNQAAQSDQNSQNENNSSDANAAQDKERDTETEKQQPEENKNGDVVVQTAKKSEGMTHLARRAIKEYLEANNEKLNEEQKIYAEDYLQKKKGTKSLEIGEKVQFGKESIKNSVEQAKNLNQKQIENLSKFVPLANLN